MKIIERLGPLLESRSFRLCKEHLVWLFKKISHMWTTICMQYICKLLSTSCMILIKSGSSGRTCGPQSSVLTSLHPTLPLSSVYARKLKKPLKQKFPRLRECPMPSKLTPGRCGSHPKKLVTLFNFEMCGARIGFPCKVGDEPYPGLSCGWAGIQGSQN